MHQFIGVFDARHCQVFTENGCLNNGVTKWLPSSQLSQAVILSG